MGMPQSQALRGALQATRLLARQVTTKRGLARISGRVFCDSGMLSESDARRCSLFQKAHEHRRFTFELRCSCHPLAAVVHVTPPPPPPLRDLFVTSMLTSNKPG
jgi:hypothetical protein